METNWKPYLPGALMLLFAWFCIRVPAIAVFFVSGILFFLGSVYLLIVYKIQKAKKAANDQYSADNQTESGIHDINDPSFTNVSTYIFKNGRWMAEETFGNKGKH